MYAPELFMRIAEQRKKFADVSAAELDAEALQAEQVGD
jgi:hypothetical protein